MYSSNNNASIVREDKITLTEASSGFSIEIYLLIELHGNLRNIEGENKLSLCTLTHIIHSQIIFILISKGKSLQLILDEWKCWEKYLHLFLPSHYIYFLFFSLLLFPGRYYRANSVRFPTQPCEGVCSLNHYCAITRIDYREFRQCLETAASALASRTQSMGDKNSRILLLLIAFLQFVLHQQLILTQFLASVVQLNSSVVKGFKTIALHLNLMNLRSQQVC